MIAEIITGGMAILALSTYEINKLIREEDATAETLREKYIEMLEELSEKKSKIK